MTGHVPDYSMLMVGANAGVVGMTKGNWFLLVHFENDEISPFSEHLGLALALNVPVFVVVTKVFYFRMTSLISFFLQIDMCPHSVLQETLKLLQKLLKSPGCRKLPVLVQSIDDVIVSSSNFCSERYRYFSFKIEWYRLLIRICPIFQVSNVTGQNLHLLRMFLNLLPVRSVAHEEDPAEFQIDDTYWVNVSVCVCVCFVSIFSKGCRHCMQWYMFTRCHSTQRCFIAWSWSDWQVCASAD